MTSPQTTSRSIGRIACLVILLFAALLLLPAEGRTEGAAAADAVRGFYDMLLSTMRVGQQLGQHGRYAKLEPVILKVFDVAYMTRIAVGSSWAATPELKQHQVAEAFGRYITATWADRFDSYSGEKLEVTGVQPYRAGALVHTRIVKSNGEQVAIDYLMRRNGDAWQIADVYLTGTVSELATRRAEFSSVLRSQGIDGLIATLNRKAGIMVSAALPPGPGSEPDGYSMVTATSYQVHRNPIGGCPAGCAGRTWKFSHAIFSSSHRDLRPPLEIAPHWRGVRHGVVAFSIPRASPNGGAGDTVMPQLSAPIINLLAFPPANTRKARAEENHRCLTFS